LAKGLAIIWTTQCAASSIAEHIYSDAELYADFHHPQCSQWLRSLANPKPEYLLLGG
jgi:hypothetical protein